MNDDEQRRGPRSAQRLFVWSCSAVSRVLCVRSAGVRAADPAAQTAAPRRRSKSPERALLDQYCVTCHNQRAKTANITFDTMDLAQLPSHADVWEKVVRKLRGGMMPPPGMRRPDQAAVDGFVSWLVRSLDQAAAANPNPGRVALHRLNRAEYAAAIEELLALRIDASAFLPQDDEADGFDNVASVLKVSPSFLDQYISAARVVSDAGDWESVAETGAAPPTVRREAPIRACTSTVCRSAPAADLLAEHLFPADGEYKLNIGGLAGAGYVRGMEYRHTLVATIDGVKVFEAQIGGEEDMKAIDQLQAPGGRRHQRPLPEHPGQGHGGAAQDRRHLHRQVVRGVRRGAVLVQAGRGEERIPRVGSVEVVGPFNPAGLSETPSRKRIFVCRPTTAPDARRDETAVRDEDLLDVRAPRVSPAGHRQRSRGAARPSTRPRGRRAISTRPSGMG